MMLLETWEQAAIRETLEETGYQVTIQNMWENIGVRNFHVVKAT